MPEGGKGMMRLNDLYEIHDALEGSLRFLTLKRLQSASDAAWKAHDLLERLIISEQARQARR